MNEAVKKEAPEQLTYRVVCKRKGVFNYFNLTSPQWEICPICGGTAKECGFAYSLVGEPTPA